MDKENIYLQSIGIGSHKPQQEIFIPDEDFDMEEFKQSVKDAA